MRNLLNTKTTGLVLVLALLLCLGATQKAHAELLYDTIDDIQVPSNVTWGAQVEWQGHAITAVRKEGNLYIVEVARDSIPHELPYFSVSFDSNWNYLGTVRTFNPAVEKRMQEAQQKAEQDKQRQQQAEQDRIRQEQDRQRQEEEERKKPKPEQPPITKPPEEQPAPESPDDDDNGRGNDE